MWTHGSIGDALTLIQNGVNCKQDKSGVGEKITRIETIADSSINYEKTGFAELDQKQKTKAELEVGDILFSHINSPIHVGKTAVYDGKEPLFHGINLLRLRTIDAVDSSYFNMFLVSLFQSGYWKRTAKQSVNQASVNQTDIKSAPFSYPPLAEQQRIVAKLDAAFAEIDRAIEVEQSQLQLFNQAREANLTEKFQALGDECEFLHLSDACTDFSRGKSKHRPRNDEKLYGKIIPFVQTGDISNAPKYLRTYSKMYSDFGVQQSKRWNKGTVCITIAANIAELAILDIDACFPDSVIGAFPNSEITSSEYLFYLLNFFQKKIKGKSKGSAQQNINLATFSDEVFPFPALKVQHKIVSEILELETGVEEIIACKSKKIDALEALKSAILAQELQPPQSEAA